ncbi:hypothetical protein cypCar_00022375, partial [Cyprinus carpio]
MLVSYYFNYNCSSFWVFYRQMTTHYQNRVWHSICSVVSVFSRTN